MDAGTAVSERTTAKTKVLTTDNMSSRFTFYGKRIRFDALQLF